MKSNLKIFLVLLISFLIAPACYAQSFPSKPIRLVIGFTPGALTDGIARVLAIEMGQRLGQAVVLEFRPGANGTIAAKYVAAAPPDGHTLYFGSVLPMHSTFSLHNAVDAEKELVAMSRVATQPFYLMSSAKLPVKTFKDLVAYSKANPDGLNQGSSTTLQDLVMDVLHRKTGFKTRSIPFKGSGQVAAALLAGDVDLTAGGVLAYVPHVQSGNVRVLLVAAKQRSSAFPDVPSAVDAGIPDFEVGLDYGFWAPVGIPRENAAKIDAAIAAAMKVPEVLQRIQGFSAEPVDPSPENAASAFLSSVKYWKEAAQAAGFKPR